MLLYRNDTIFLEYPRYEFVGDYVIDVNEFDNSTWEKGDVTFSGNVTEENLKKYIKDAAQKVTVAKPNVSKYYRGESIETVVKECDAIFKVKPICISSISRFEDMTVYDCEVIECIKGEVTTNVDGYVFLRLQSNVNLKEETEYIIPLSYRESGTFYDQASPICIFDATDKETEAKIKEWLSEKNVP